MERSSIISDEQVKCAVAALTEIASGTSNGIAVIPEVRARAAETLLGHAFVYDGMPEPGAPPEEEL